MRTILALCLFAPYVGTLAAEDEPSLATVVGNDAALFVEVRDLDRQWTAISQSGFGQRWQASELSKLFWQSPAGRKWRALDEQVAAATGGTITEQLRALFGDAVALALYLPDEPHSGDPRGVLLARATSAAAVERVLKSWDRIEPPLKTERRASLRGSYIRRVMKRGTEERSLYYATKDRFFVLSDHESLVLQCLDRWLAVSDPSAGADPVPSLASSPEFQEIAARWPDDAVAVAYLPPRRWDAALLHKTPEDAPGRLVLDIWKSLRGVGAAVRANSGMQLDVSLLMQPDRVSSEWRAFAANSAMPTMIDLAPRDAVAVLAARFPPRLLIERWRELLSERERNDLNKGLAGIRGLLLDRDLLTDAAPQLFANWGVMVQAQPDASAEAPPERPQWWHGWTATAMGFVPQDAAPALRESVDNALLFGMNLIALDRNTRADSAGVRVVTTRTESGLRRVLRGFPDLRPGYAWRPDRWLLSNQENGLDTLTAAADVPPSATETPLRLAAARHFPHAQLVAWSNLARLRETRWLQRLTVADRKPPLVILHHLPGVADEAFVAGSWTETSITVSAGLMKRE